RRDDQRRIAACGGGGSAQGRRPAGGRRRARPDRVAGCVGARTAATRPENPGMFNIVLVAPEIPPNTGNVIRLAANTGCALHLVEPLGFSMDDRRLRRAGLDYHETAAVRRHASWPAFIDDCAPPPARLYAFSTRGERRFADIAWRPDDWLVFGSETAGLANAVLDTIPAAQRVRLPMRPGQRSLNLGNAVAVAVFEAWRQNGYAGSV